MLKAIRLKRGLNIRLQGEAEKILVQAGPSEMYALKPTDFHNLVPKLAVRPGEKVKAGSPLFFDKHRPEILFTSPVSGNVAAVIRGERRRILEVTVKADVKTDYLAFRKADPSVLSREEIIDNLLQSGVWPFIRQRPYGIVANPSEVPRSIFISAFDTAPLAPDMDFVLHGEDQNFNTGLKALARLTDGNIHLGIHSVNTCASMLKNAQGVEIHSFKGPHPAGNVGVQIHHIDPVKKGEVVWYINPQDVIIVGRLFLEGRFNPSRIVALTGSEVLRPRYFRTAIGASIKGIVHENVADGELRYISGNVLTGDKISSEGYVGFYDSQVTVIPEGKYHEFLGWGMPGLKKFSHSRSFVSWLMPGEKYRLDTNLHGGERPFVMTGEYERVLPMDIYPVQLLKAILVEDIDRMENLGIYELVEEDLALCEFVCASKIDVQAILRQGIDLMIKELS